MRRISQFISSEQPSPERRLTMFYILALGAVALLTMTGQLLIQLSLIKQSHDSRVINIAGRQRMLSQRLTKAALSIGFATEERVIAKRSEELQKVVNLWERSHRGLQHGDADMGLPGTNSDQVTEMFAAIQPNHLAMLDAVTHILALQESQDAAVTFQSDIAPYVETILQHESRFLPGMDDIVFQYDAEANTRVTRLKVIELLLMGVTLTILLLEGLFIFRPTAQSIQAAFLHVQRMKQAVEHRAKDLSTALEHLNSVAALATKMMEGDLTGMVAVRSKDDTFGQAIQGMMQGLSTLVRQIRDTAGHIETAVNDIASLAVSDIHLVEQVHRSSEIMVSTMQEMGSSVEEVALNMDLLSSSVETTSGAVTQMASSITHISSHAVVLNRQASDTITSMNDNVRALDQIVSHTDASRHLSQDTIQDARDGQQAVEHVMSSMETIQQTISSAVEMITSLEQRSREIDTVLAVIRDITEQTSLLALNAAIIAAQAGDHGRGFAVVADEIKGLADGVATSTKDIGVIVRALQEDTTKVVSSIHAGVSDVRQGLIRTQEARDMLEKILSSTQRSSSLVGECTGSLHELKSSMHGVAAKMEQGRGITEKITHAATEQEQSTTHIRDAIEQVNHMTSQIQQATSEQLSGVQRVLDDTMTVVQLVDHNLESSQSIMKATRELSSQVEHLVYSVARFKLHKAQQDVFPNEACCVV